MIEAFFTKTATKKVLSSTPKTKRTFGGDTTFRISEPQPKTEMDLVAGVYVTKYYLYADFDASVVQNDKIIIDGNDYLVLEVHPHKVRNIEYKHLITVRD
jgi:hypothetical protein